ncbi:DUF413 domain-containing protein [Motilimonas eburnea]|uniref:DUF413 domain-containing protein n=1 Tax=Motilimonas eburnea TaxID=1737488 RepID=UPI001E3C8129|nr:DUF413 domain-containing protein [Motilimonas eburnea]MCE2573147.1 DUF413 domain-containing protein [Motilimonas eburnea]
MATSFACGAAFYDDQSFPYGFKRSGDFTIKEAELLESIGRTLMALAKGEQTPMTDEEKRFVKVAQGEVPAESVVEKVWIKYRTLAKGKTFFGVTGNPNRSQINRELETEEDEE